MGRSECSTFDGRFLTPHFWWVLSGPVPDAGYCIGAHHQLYHNGQKVGEVLKLEWDREVGSWWVHYRAQRGGPMDMAATT